MIVDDSVLAQSPSRYGIVIVGAGPVGLTLAHALGARGRRVLVIEAGGVKETRAGRDAYAGEVADGACHHPPTDMYRIRALGGTSRIWGGRCIPYDPIDFTDRAWIGGPGWPIGYDELAPYYPAAMAAAEAGGVSDDPAFVLPDEPPELVPGLDGATVRTTLERFSKPTDFWRLHREELTRSADVDVLPHATVTALRLTPDGRRVHVVELATRSRRFRLSAPTVVLAGGGLEVTRLLLASQDVKPDGLGNAGGQLGRNYMSHLCASVAVASFTPRGGALQTDYRRDAGGVYVRRRLWLTEDAQRRRRLPNITFRTHLPDPSDPRHGDPVLSAMYLAKRLVQREYAAKFGQTPFDATSALRHFGNLARSPGVLARFGADWMRRRILADRKLPSVALPSAKHRYHLEFHAEQMPNPLSRVTLVSARDDLGVPRLRVDWRVTDEDIAGVQRAHATLADALTESGAGRLDYDDDAIADAIRREGVVGGHHLGTTRMAARESEGVVDAQCRVHGLANLYVASASVLPTAGQANPTLTVLALALRLADRLTGETTKCSTIPSRAELARTEIG